MSGMILDGVLQIRATEIVLSDADVASALVDFIVRNTISNLVVGISNRSALTRSPLLIYITCPISKYMFHWFCLISSSYSIISEFCLLSPGHSEIQTCQLTWAKLHQISAQWMQYQKEKFKLLKQLVGLLHLLPVLLALSHQINQDIHQRGKQFRSI